MGGPASSMFQSECTVNYSGILAEAGIQMVWQRRCGGLIVSALRYTDLTPSG